MRNTNSYFATLPDVDIRRSAWRAPYNKKMTLSAGKLYPIACIEVLPGDTITLPDMSHVTRMTTPIHPVMDTSYQDFYWFFVPNRLVMDDWKAFMGENTEGEWLTDMPDVSMPMLTLSAGMPAGAEPKTLADYFGLPTWQQVDATTPDQFEVIRGDYEARYQSLPFRAYCLIWNEWFRNQATHAPIPIYKDDLSRPLWNRITYANEAYNELPASEWYKYTAQLGGHLAPVAKFADYFTTALPAPQKGEDVLIGSLSNGHTNVFGSEDFLLPRVGETTDFDVPGNFSSVVQLASNLGTGGPWGQLSPAGRPVDLVYGSNGELGVQDNASSDDSEGGVNFVNLGFNNNQIDITINQLRQAFQVQKFLEKQSMYGSRYTEMIRSFFGVTSPDARLQRPEYIGGKRIPINMQQVLQTSATNDVTPQGNTAAFSLTSRNGQSMFKYSSTEHGFIIGVTCVRTSQTYQYGVRRMWTRENKLDYYFPTFANIGNTPILNREIFQTFTDVDDEAFGYQEAWAEYRYLPSEIVGEFRSQYYASLDSWHYAEKLSDTPTLSESFINQSENVIDRTLAVSSQLADQFYSELQMNFQFVRPMPVNSIPGLVDHH